MDLLMALLNLMTWLWVGDCLIEQRAACPWLHHWGIWLSFLQKHGSSGKVGLDEFLLHPWWNVHAIVLLKSCAGGHHCWVHQCNIHVMYVGKRVFWSTPSYSPPTLTFFPPLPPWCSMGLGVGHIDVPFRAKHSTVTYSPHFDQQWISTLTETHPKRISCDHKLIYGFDTTPI